MPSQEMVFQGAVPVHKQKGVLQLPTDVWGILTLDCPLFVRTGATIHLFGPLHRPFLHAPIRFLTHPCLTHLIEKNSAEGPQIAQTSPAKSSQRSRKVVMLSPLDISKKVLQKAKEILFLVLEKTTYIYKAQKMHSNSKKSSSKN